MKDVDVLWHDAAFAGRLLRKSPIFTAAIVLTLALGFGVNTVVFSVINALILRPLPVRDADRLVVIATQDAERRTLGAVSLPDLEDYRAATREVFEDIAGYSAGFQGLAIEGSRPERVLVTWVSANYFALLDLRPALGRLIQPEDSGAGRADAVVVLGYSTWQRRFGGDRAMLGRTVRVNGRPCEIIGVAPSGFAGTFAFSESELYLPLDPPGTDDRQARGIHAFARLQPHSTVAAAQAAMTVVAGELARKYPVSNSDVTVRVVPERLARPEEDQFRTNAIGSLMMLALVVLVMIVAAVNVTNLLLARTSSRRCELAIRSALGAGRGRLVRQMVTESLLLATLGGAAGVLAAIWAAGVLATTRPPGDLPVRFDFQPDVRVLAYAVLLTVGTGLLIGVLSASRIPQADLDRLLRESRQASPGVHRHRIRRFLVVAQIACCFLLLSVAGLFARSLLEAERADLGFRPDGVLNVHLDVGQLGYSEAQGRTFFDEVERRVRAIPGIQTVSFASTVPMGYIRLNSAVEAEGRAGAAPGSLSAGNNIVSSEYFDTLGIPIVRGRSFTAADDEHSRPAAVINEQLAHLLWPGQSVIGRRFRPAGSNEPWIEVVGVTRTGKYRFLFEDPQPYFYVPIAQQYAELRVLQVRTSISPTALAPVVEKAIRDLEPDLPLYDVQTMTRALGSGPGFFPMRAGAIGAAAFGLLAFGLAIVGLYGVTSYVTAQRTHEIGIRVAMGATRRDVLRLFLHDASNVVVRGIGLGLLLTLACSRVIGSFLFGLSARDPLTLAGLAAILAAVAMVACAVPAWRAARVDPMIALRSE